MSESNRLISFLQVFGIILVVIGHSFVEQDIPLLYNWIYNFHMPLFMFISGYLFLYAPMSKKQKIDDIKLLGTKGFIFKKFKRLIIPYIFISSITFFPKVFLSRYALRPIELSLDSWWHMLIYPLNNVIIYFWFLPTLFIIMLIVISATKLFNKLIIKIPFILLLIICLFLNIFNPLKQIEFLNLSGVVNYLLYFVLGIYFCKKQFVFQNLFNKYLYQITFTLLLLTILFSTINIYSIIKAITGIFFSISISYIYIRNNWKFFNHLNGSSYAIYLFSWYPQSFIRVLFSYKDISWQLSMILSIILGIYFPFLLYKFFIFIKKRFKYGKQFALLFGQ